MAETDEEVQMELIKQLGERMNMFARLQSDFMKQLAERVALMGRMHAEAVSQFNRSAELTEKVAAGLAARIQARLAKA